ncbi:MAG: toll/interleukin-1 receptor domain-containing protein, partial [Clostridia bacterium]|nr:toll/interleukin-1 receptor domain-containing protein [Clostridia bacterium]
MAFDVFISFKNTDPSGGLTKDRAIAERLHSELRNEGLEVFFSEKDLSSTVFMDQIYGALEDARMLILIGTSVEFITSKWVKSEWQNFLGAINSGKKPDAQMMTVLSGISARDLPIQISNFQSFDAADIDSAVDFVFESLGKIKNSDIDKFMLAEEERKRREAEDAKRREAQLRMEAERKAAQAEENARRAEE